MVQPPFQSDAFQVMGDADGVRLLEAAADGSLTFKDALVPLGIRLADLAGLQQIQNLLIVSPSGIGASKGPDGLPLTTIQAALDAVPPGTGELTPFTILVGPGVYYEDLLWTRDGVCMVALGQVVLRQLTGGSSTLRMLAAPAEAPKWARLIGFRIENTEATKSCVELSTSTFAIGTIALTGPGVVGDSVEVAGVTFTAILSTGTPVAGQFRLGTTATETASGLLEALVDPVNGLLGVVKPSTLANIVTIRAALPGVAGNAITLSTAQPLVYVLSGPALSGGQDFTTNSLVGQSLVSLEGCQFAQTGIGGFPVLASSINNLQIVDSDLSPSPTSGTVYISNCASVLIRGCFGVPNLEMYYNNADPYLPFVGGCSYQVVDTRVQSAVQASLLGIGSLLVQGVEMDSLSLAGDRALRVEGSEIYGPVVVGGSANVTFSKTTRGSLSGGLSALVRESQHLGGLSFSSSALEVYQFGYTCPDANFTVLMELAEPLASVADIPRVTAKSTTGFTVEFGAVQTRDVFFSVLRDL
jgi:hypothetical protein